MGVQDMLIYYLSPYFKTKHSRSDEGEKGLNLRHPDSGFNSFQLHDSIVMALP